jgi:hypothetical protein
MFLISWGGFLGVALVKAGDDLGGVVEVRGWVPRFVLVMESCPLYSVLKAVLMIAGIKDFFDFPFLFVVYDDSWGRWLYVARDGLIPVFSGLEEGDVEYWIYFHTWGEIQFICS